MSQLNEITHIESVRLSDDCSGVVIIDQTKLPSRTEYLTLTTAEDIWEAIHQLKVRGAPAIGICAGYGIYCLARQIKAADYEEFLHIFQKHKDYLLLPSDCSQLKLGTEPYGTRGHRKQEKKHTRHPESSEKRMSGHPSGGHPHVPSHLGIWSVSFEGG